MEGLVWPVGSSYSRRPPQTRGQWGLKLLLFFGPKRQDDKDSIPLGLLTPGCTAEVVDMEGGRGGGEGCWGGSLGRGLIQKINPMEFSPHCKWRFRSFCLAIWAWPTERISVTQ